MSMQCSNCQRENDPTYRFCIFCGSPLMSYEVRPLSQAVQPHVLTDTGLVRTDESPLNTGRFQMEVTTNYAGLLRRLLASIIDASILGALFPIVFMITYYVYYENSQGRYLDFAPLGAGFFYWFCFGIIY